MMHYSFCSPLEYRKQFVLSLKKWPGHLNSKKLFQCSWWKGSESDMVRYGHRVMCFYISLFTWPIHFLLLRNYRVYNTEPHNLMSFRYIFDKFKKWEKKRLQLKWVSSHTSNSLSWEELASAFLLPRFLPVMFFLDWSSASLLGVVWVKDGLVEGSPGKEKWDTGIASVVTGYKNQSRMVSRFSALKNHVAGIKAGIPNFT